MDVHDHIRLVPEIEQKIVEHRLDALVLGMGPTGWLCRWMNRDITAPLRIWACHDADRLGVPLDDLVVMDTPFKGRLSIGQPAHKVIVDSRPKRLWIYHPFAKCWMPHLHSVMHKVTETVHWYVWNYSPKHPANAMLAMPDKFRLEDDPLHTGWVSPTGTVTLAWREGARRIGVLGVDMRKFDHHTYENHRQVDEMMVALAREAHEKGGCVVNLSPLTSLEKFATWTPSASSSAPTNGSVTQEPNSSSNIPSAPALSESSTSGGCDQAILGMRFRAPEKAAPGSVEPR